MGKTFTVELTVPEGLVAGDVFTAEIEMPAKVRKPRGQLAGLTLEEMTDDQLKREIINAKSVLYKAKQRGASEETIAANQARVDAALAEKAKRAPVVAQATEAPNVASIMDEETADEI
jgi:hypothetical protein